MGRKRKVALGTFEDMVERAVEKLEGGEELAEDEMNLYMQKRVLNHMECADALVLHGLVRNLGAAHFGAAEKPDDNTVGVLKDAAGRPVLPDYSFCSRLFRIHKISSSNRKPYRNPHFPLCGIAGYLTHLKWIRYGEKHLTQNWSSVKQRLVLFGTKLLS